MEESQLGKRKRGDENETTGEKRAKPLANGAPLYCICRKPDDGREMIMCDACQDWFHLECLKISMPGANERFECPPCKARKEKRRARKREQSRARRAAEKEKRERAKAKAQAEKEKKEREARASVLVEEVWEDEEVGKARAQNIPVAYVCCARKGCGRLPRNNSKYCSHDCGILAARARVVGWVEGVVQANGQAWGEAVGIDLVDQVIAMMNAENAENAEKAEGGGGGGVLVGRPGVAMMGEVEEGEEEGVVSVEDAEEEDGEDVEDVEDVEDGEVEEMDIEGDAAGATTIGGALWEKEEKELERLGVEKGRVEARLEVAEEEMEKLMEAIAQAGYAVEEGEEGVAGMELARGTEKSGGGEQQIPCMLCGQSYTGKAYAVHVATCLRKSDVVNLAYGTEFYDPARSGSWMCGKKIRGSSLFCTQPADACPFHVSAVKIQGVRKAHPCGFPFHLYPDPTRPPPAEAEVCALSRSACARHSGWEDTHVRALRLLTQSLSDERGSLDREVEGIHVRRRRRATSRHNQ